MFNRRRVSRDAAVCEDILKTVRGEKLFIKPYSEKLFAPLAEKYEPPSLCDDPLRVAKDGEWCFIEDEDISPYLECAEKVLLYNWNENYPFDLKFDLNLLRESFRLSERRKFEGRAHDEIVRELYRKDFRGKI